MKTTALEENWQTLAAGIVQIACEDYINALNGIRPLESTHPYQYTLAEIERFCHSEWFTILSDLDPDPLLASLKRRAAELGKKRFNAHRFWGQVA